MLIDLKKYSENIAVISDEGITLTYNELNDKINQLISYLTPHSLVFCLCENSVGSLTGYLSCLRAQAPAMLFDRYQAGDAIQRLSKLYKPHYFWMPSTMPIDIGKTVFSMYGYKLIETSHSIYPIHPELALLLSTSGSTGSPKQIRISFNNIRCNAESIAEFLKITPQDRPITSLQMYYSFGLSVINSHMLRGATILLTSKPVTDENFWIFLKKNRATFIAGVPYTYEVLRRLHIFDMDLPSLKTMAQAGGKLNGAIVREYIQHMNSIGGRFFVMYGQTEATARMSYLPIEQSLEKYNSIGIAIPGGRFSLIDLDGKEILENNVDGELVYHGPNVSMGYCNGPEDLAKGDNNNGVLRTGDMARRDEDNYYYITGRLKRFVKIWGNRCNLDATEQLCKRVTPNCACVGVDDLITVFVTEHGFETRIKGLLCSMTGLNGHAFAVKVIPEIPKSASGKILYGELQKML